MTKITASNFFRFEAFNEIALAGIFCFKLSSFDLLGKNGSEKNILHLNLLNNYMIFKEGDSRISAEFFL